MADVTAITRNEVNGNPVVHSFLKSDSYSSGIATFPSGAATATIPKVGRLTDKSIVIIRATKNNNSTELIEIYASRTKGDNGTITVGTLDGGNTSSTVTFFWKKINP